MDASQMEALDRPKRTVMPMRSDERLAQRIATEVLPRYPVTSILDIGCGDGVVSKHLTGQTNYRGLDINEACIYEQEHDNPIVNYVQPEAIAKITQEEGPWDMILLLDVLEHTRDFTGLFEQAMLSSEKYVIVSLPNELFFLDRLRMLRGRELNAHSLDLVGLTEGFKHQFIVNINKARSLLIKKAREHSFLLIEEVVRPLKPKRQLLGPIAQIITKLRQDQVWSQGSIFIFHNHT
ncbi:Conserved hypothetical protein [Synechococcus sp. RCC307]|nr:Conserved hypothetical protein [Synechococcus sp. RCC307]